jgi:hypothetical protein
LPAGWLLLFAASLLLWPRQALGEIPLYGFLPHGLFAGWLLWRGLRGCGSGRRRPCCCRPVVAMAMGWRTEPVLAAAAAGRTCCAPSRPPSDGSAISRLLLNLLEVCAYFTAPPIALLGVYSFWHGSLPEVLQWMAQAGACCMLAMTSCLPLLRLPACRSPPPAGVAGDLAGDAGGGRPW